MDIIDRDIETAAPGRLVNLRPQLNGRQHTNRSYQSSGRPRFSISSTVPHDPAAAKRPEFVHRVTTHKIQHQATVGSSPFPLAESPSDDSETIVLPPFGAGKMYPPDLPGRELYVVEFDGKDDPLHGVNWPTRKKITVALLLAFATWTVTLSSSIYAPAIPFVSSHFNISTELTTLGISLYVLGFASGPVLWAPLSELTGRRLPMLLSSFLFLTFCLAIATANDPQTVLICRFFAGFSGACQISVSPAVFADIFGAQTRGLAIAVFICMIYFGTLMAPFVGGFISSSHLGWRWTEYLTSIIGALSFFLNFAFLPETYPPMILVSKAAELRRKTKNWGIHAKQEEVEIDFLSLIAKNFSRPLRFLFTEPIVFCVSLYNSAVYGLVYTFLTAYDIVFQEIHGMSAGVGGLAYFGLLGGVVLGCFVAILMHPAYCRKLKRNNGIPVPEWRMPPVILGGTSFAVGLFWFGWAGHWKSVHWIVPTLSGLCTGFGILTIFLQMLNYLIDSYIIFAASAVAASTILRSAAASSCPMFASYLFHRLGINWGITLLASFATLMVPIPIWFYLRGEQFRIRSKFAPTIDKIEMETEEEDKEV